MKHLDLVFYWLRDIVEKKTILPIYILTQDNPADLLTKALKPIKFEGFRNNYGLKDVPD